MKDEQTICYKISRCIEDIEDSVKTGHLSVGVLANRLHNIRTDAQNMENGLRDRKKIMIENELEEKYQSNKNNGLTGINKIKTVEVENTKEKTEFNIVVKKNNKIIYKNDVLSGVFSFVEKISDIDENGEIIGQTQKLVFGHPLAFWFAYDQLRQSIEAKSVEIMLAMKNAVENKNFVDPKVKLKIINFANQIKE